MDECGANLACGARSSVDSVKNWLQLAFPHVNHTDAADQIKALKMVLKTGTLLGSEEDTPEDLMHFKELLKTKLLERVDGAVDDLPSLFAGSIFSVSELFRITTECSAATEACTSQRSKVNQPTMVHHLDEVSIIEEVEQNQQDPPETLVKGEAREYDILGTKRWKRSYLDGASTLTKTGRNQVLVEAVADTSNFVCPQCGGVISNHRKDQHLEAWCIANAEESTQC